MAKPDSDDPAPSFVEVLELAESRSRQQPLRQTAAVKLAQLMARAHREHDPGKRPILVKLPPKRQQ